MRAQELFKISVYSSDLLDDRLCQCVVEEEGLEDFGRNEVMTVTYDALNLDVDEDNDLNDEFANWKKTNVLI